MYKKLLLASVTLNARGYKPPFPVLTGCCQTIKKIMNPSESHTDSEFNSRTVYTSILEQQYLIFISSNQE